MRTREARLVVLVRTRPYNIPSAFHPVFMTVHTPYWRLVGRVGGDGERNGRNGGEQHLVDEQTQRVRGSSVSAITASRALQFSPFLLTSLRQRQQTPRSKSCPVRPIVLASLPGARQGELKLLAEMRLDDGLYWLAVALRRR